MKPLDTPVVVIPWVIVVPTPTQSQIAALEKALEAVTAELDTMKLDIGLLAEAVYRDAPPPHSGQGFEGGDSE